MTPANSAPEGILRRIPLHWAFLRVATLALVDGLRLLHLDDGPAFEYKQVL
jgi:hypothetical protein